MYKKYMISWFPKGLLSSIHHPHPSPRSTNIRCALKHYNLFDHISLYFKKSQNLVTELLLKTFKIMLAVRSCNTTPRFIKTTQENVPKITQIQRNLKHTQIHTARAQKSCRRPDILQKQADTPYIQPPILTTGVLSSLI